MRRILTAIATLSLITLASVSQFCVGDLYTLTVDASVNTVDIENAKSYKFPVLGPCYIVLNGSWYSDSTNDHRQEYVVSYYSLGSGTSRVSEMLVVGERHEWTIEEGAFFYFYFPDPDDVSDNHGVVTVKFVHGTGPVWKVEWIHVAANENSVLLANAESYEFPSDGDYELVIRGHWHYDQTDAYPQDYVLAYYSESGSDRFEKLDRVSQHLWTASGGAHAYFYVHDCGAVSDNHGEVTIEINARQNQGQDQGLGEWYLKPEWIAVWLAIIGVVVGVVGVVVARKVRH